VASPFLTPFKLSLVTAIFLAVPYLLYQTWAFIAPGLYQHERKLVVPLLASSTVLFYTGIAFAYYVVFPLVFGFFIGAAPEGVAVMTDISKYLDFVLKLFLAFGIAFEVPIATILICWTGMTTPDKLAEKRSYVIVAAFIIGMLMTPPDVISQTLLALPMWLLFEVGIFFARRMPTRENADEVEEEENSIGGGVAHAAVAATVVGSAARPEVEDEALEEADLDEEQELDEEDMDAELDRMEAEEDELNREDKAIDEASTEKPDKPE
jgi:sec-independent protein translocase protein TatC